MLPFWKSLEFYNALSFVIAAVYLYFYPDSLVTAGSIFLVIQGVLKFFNVTPELRARGLW